MPLSPNVRTLRASLVLTFHAFLLSRVTSLFIFESLARAPSAGCGLCLLTKFGLAQFAARLFCRLADEWCVAFNIFNALSWRKDLTPQSYTCASAFAASPQHHQLCAAVMPKNNPT